MKMKALEKWNLHKFETVSQTFKVKRHLKDDVVIESGKEVEQVIMVRKGSLRLRKNFTLTKNNVWPATKAHCWDVSKAINEEELTVARVGPGKLIGLQEIR